MKFSLLNSASLFLCGLFSTTAALPAFSSPGALSTRAVDGTNVVYAEADNRVFVGMDGQWEEHIEGQVPLAWAETHRDDTTVYMERGNGYFKLELDVANSITRLIQGSDPQFDWKLLITSTISAEYPINGYTAHYAESTAQDRAFYGGNGVWYERVTPSTTNMPIKWTVTGHDRAKIYLERTGFKLVIDVEASRTFLQRPDADLVGWKFLAEESIAAKVPANGWTVNYTEGPERNFEGVTTTGAWNEICTSGSCVHPWTEVKREENVIYLERGGYKLEIDLSTGWYRLETDDAPSNWKTFTLAKFVPE